MELVFGVASCAVGHAGHEGGDFGIFLAAGRLAALPQNIIFGEVHEEGGFLSTVLALNSAVQDVLLPRPPPLVEFPADIRRQGRDGGRRWALWDRQFGVSLPHGEACVV